MRRNRTLIISVKTSSQMLSDFSEALDSALNGKLRKLRKPKIEICFDNKSDLKKFVANLDVLSAIHFAKPKSIYELAKLLGTDESNLKKVVSFFRKFGVIKVKTSMANGRTIKTPIVEFDSIRFDLPNDLAA